MSLKEKIADAGLSYVMSKVPQRSSIPAPPVVVGVDGIPRLMAEYQVIQLKRQHLERVNPFKVAVGGAVAGALVVGLVKLLGG